MSADLLPGLPPVHPDAARSLAATILMHARLNGVTKDEAVRITRSQLAIAAVEGLVSGDRWAVACAVQAYALVKDRWFRYSIAKRRAQRSRAAL